MIHTDANMEMITICFIYSFIDFLIFFMVLKKVLYIYNDYWSVILFSPSEVISLARDHKASCRHAPLYLGC